MLWHHPTYNAGTGAWLLSQPPNVNPQLPDAPKHIASTGSSSAVQSPETVDWTGAQLTMYRVEAVRLGTPSAEGRLRADEQEQDQWCDTIFPAAPSSIGLGIPRANALHWVRAPALLPEYELPQLFHKVEPDDILQVLLH